jgi:hypothetical protein
VNRAAGAGLTALLLLTGCASLRGPRAPVLVPLGADDPRPAADLASLGQLVAQRQSLRARAKLTLEAPSGGSTAHQLLLVERPARLRVEVMALLGQRAAILTTDGIHYELYRAGQGGLEAGLIRPSILWEVAGVPLTPEAAVRILLAAPPPPGDPGAASAAGDSQGGVHLHWPDASLAFDAEGRLRRYELLGTRPASVLVDARFDDYADVGGEPFPRRIRLDFPASETRAEVSYQSVELNPELPPALFQLRTPGAGAAPAGGKAE